jgi:hypothetical protein
MMLRAMPRNTTKTAYVTSGTVDMPLQAPSVRHLGDAHDTAIKTVQGNQNRKNGRYYGGWRFKIRPFGME